MNKATATMTRMTSTRAIIDITYYFEDGRVREGFETVDAAIPSNLYDLCYIRASAAAKNHSCRLETFSQADAKPFRVRFTNFNYFADQDFATEVLALNYAESKGFEVSIHHEGRMVSTWGPISGYKAILIGEFRGVVAG